MDQGAGRQGLTERQVIHSRKQYGTNTLEKKKRTSFIKKFLLAFNDPIIRILIGALLINFLFFFQTFDVFETIGISMAILLSTLISALSERGGERAFDRLQESLTGEKCYVRRDGKLTKIAVSDVVVEDLVFIEAGERIPADGLLLQGRLSVDQSSLNGEGEEADKYPQANEADRWEPRTPSQLFRSSLVTGGEGIMQVYRVGKDTLWGSIGSGVQEDPRPSPLKLRLTKLAKQMSIVGYGAAALVALSYLCNVFLLDAGSAREIVSRLCNPAFALPQLIRALALATTIIVVAVPEGLPMMISVVLASNMKRMQRDRVLVRKSVGIETAGSMNILFTDKTGTLTLGHPVVSAIILGNGETIAPEKLRNYPVLYEMYLKNAWYNTMSVWANGKAVGGNGTDRAILESCNGTRPPQAEIGAKVPFHSKIKYSAVTIDGVRYVKGAWETLLSRAVSVYRSDGHTVSLATRAILNEKISQMTKRAMRVLAIATEKNGSLEILCFLCIRDDIRSGARAAVRTLKGAGVQVVMMTGDNVDTARAIAKDVGILDAGDNVVLSSEALSKLRDDQLRSMLPQLRVIARALPEDKSRMVRIAGEAGLTTGMTGDGINDAPSLRLADVGFAMGSGTEVAQEAGDVVILDDNISSIAKAVLYGRTIFKSIRKFIVFQLTTNLTAVAVSIICPLLGVDSPVTVLQMLWINMIMDTFGSLAFAGEAALREYMLERPKNREEKILNAYMVWRIILSGGYILFLCLRFITSPMLRLLYGYETHPVTFLCAFFTLFIFADLANCFSARTVRLNPFSSLIQNRPFVGILSMIVAIQMLMIYFGGAVFRTTSLSPLQFLLPFGLALTVIPFNMVAKLILKLFFRRDTL